MQRVLIVDDEPHMRQLIKIYLQSSGFESGEAPDGASCLKELETGAYHLLILDLMMPGMDGFETCARVRERWADLPVLMLTARNAVEDKVAGLGLGADDYLVKPFDGRELVARVQALLRRTHLEDDAIEVQSLQLRIDPQARTVTIMGKAVNFTHKEFDLLLLLIRRPGRTFSRDDLLNGVWGDDFFGDARTVDSHIKNIREKMREAGVKRDPIETVWGVGYRFNPD
ncbi:response regulator transcription factor [Alicyclobacillus tolerans]|uniref:response regulator transcription factor n=1 Tax=Alicyclobacillus tolerans TaxID=90970 RepID=UPI001F2D0B92|nr:response regulator transcription factor [Alicyclobacillus tolerans]MCF8568181.1 response regulator transcription factor [Alicyclobacillus tolerans]